VNMIHRMSVVSIHSMTTDAFPNYGPPAFMRLTPLPFQNHPGL